MQFFNGIIKKAGTKRVILISIIILASFLRLWNLGNVPPSASLDEASIGYNAYSVLKTGGDEFGKFPLISQRGYDDWRRSTYLLLVIPFVAILNLSVVAVRLPAVILSILTVWATYEIALHFFPKRSNFSITFASLSAFILAISPWHIYISRLGHESNACLSFLVFGILFFLKGLKNTKLLLLSGLFLTMSMISYYSGQVFVPLLVLGLLIIFRKKLLSIVKSDRKVVAGGIIFGLLLIPILWSVFSPAALIRFRGTSTFSTDAHLELFRKRVELRNKAVENRDIIGEIIYNRHLYPVQVLIEGYVSHFQPLWLFTNPLSDAFKAPYVGLLYMWEIPFILVGFFGIIFSKLLNGDSKKLIFLWFFLGPLPASIATQAPHAMRSYNILPTWQFLTAYGIAYILFRFWKYKTIVLVGISAVILLGFINFCNNYFVVFPRNQSRSFQYALAQTIPYVIRHQGEYKRIVFSNEDNLYQSYMLFLYHSKYDPVLYQKLGGTKSGGYAEKHYFGKYEFRPIKWSNENIKNTLFVGNQKDIPSKVSILFEGKYLNGKAGTKAVNGKPAIKN